MAAAGSAPEVVPRQTAYIHAQDVDTLRQVALVKRRAMRLSGMQRHLQPLIRCRPKWVSGFFTLSKDLVISPPTKY
jgi:hypothetical protein